VLLLLLLLGVVLVVVVHANMCCLHRLPPSYMRQAGCLTALLWQLTLDSKL
jgi:hypothetical protein